MNIFQNKKLAIVILSSALLIIIGILFIPNLWGKKVNIINKENPEITQIKSQSQDTSLDSIKKDLNNTDIDNVDRELNSIDKELNASI